MTTALLLQVLLTFTVEGQGPVRFGFPLPENALARGLAVEGVAAATLQWRSLMPRPDRGTGRRWVEIAIGGVGMQAVPQKTLRLRVGRVPATSEGNATTGAVFNRSTEVAEKSGIRTTTTTWRFADNALDRRERLEVIGGELAVDEELLCCGEATTADSPSLRARTLRVGIAAREWARAGVVPLPSRTAAPWREHLRAMGKQLRSLPGVRGAGDYVRAEGVVTNLEFDTTLGFVRLGLACGDAELLARAAQSARHLVDHDLEAGSGLPFAHGADHRDNPPEPGHAWLQGLMLTGCVFADDELIGQATSMARGLARHPRAPPQARAQDRARDVGWPLLELEAYLACHDDPPVARSADALAHEVLARFDARSGVVRFGEGERRGGAYEERAWLTGGILVPALRAHAARTGNTHAKQIVAVTQERLLALLRRGQRGIPIRYWVDRDGLGSELRLSGTAEGFLVLEGVDPADLPRVLARGPVAACLEGVPRDDDPDVATQFSIAARCTWVLR